MEWQKLERDKTLSLIESVKAAGMAPLFSPVTSEATVARLPFYSSFRLYRLTNYASMPIFSLDYIGNGSLFYYLDGTEHPIFAVNDSGALILDDSTILPYLEFYFRNVTLPEGDVYLVTNPEEDLPFFESLDFERQTDILENARPPAVRFDPNARGHSVEATLYFAGALTRASLEVDYQGRVTIVRQDMLMNAGDAAHVAQNVT